MSTEDSSKGKEKDAARTSSKDSSKGNNADLAFASVAELSREMAAGKTSSVELTTLFLSRLRIIGPGVTFMGAAGNESLCLAAAKAYQRETDWHRKRPRAASKIGV